LVDVLLGDYNPSGRLPITYPKYNHHLSSYDYKWNEATIGNSIAVEFEFGHGLSYTTFEYSNLVVPATVAWADSVTITVNVRNTGSRSGDHTVLLFVSDLYRTITPPNKELKGYKKLNLPSGETKPIEFTLTRNDLSFIGLDMKRQTESGMFLVTIILHFWLIQRQQQLLQDPLGQQTSSNVIFNGVD
jgi:beta-glucosidase